MLAEATRRSSNGWTSAQSRRLRLKRNRSRKPSRRSPRKPSQRRKKPNRRKPANSRPGIIISPPVPHEDGLFLSGLRLSIFRQGLPLCFRGPDQRDNAHKVDRGHDDAYRAEGHQRAQPAQQERKRRCQVADGIVAEADAGAAQARGEYLREVRSEEHTSEL